MDKIKVTIEMEGNKPLVITSETILLAYIQNESQPQVLCTSLDDIEGATLSLYALATMSSNVKKELTKKDAGFRKFLHSKYGRKYKRSVSSNLTSRLLRSTLEDPFEE